MNMKTLLLSKLLVLGLVAAHAAPPPPKGAELLITPNQAPPAHLPPPISFATTPPGTQQVYVYDQKTVAGRPALVSPQQAQEIIDKFKAAYPKLESPRLLIYVNRELVDEQSGLKLIARTEKVDATKTNDGITKKTAGENRYRRTERKEPALADKQTARDVERLFGRPLRLAGVSLADQRVATQLISDRAIKSLATEGEAARKDREALSKITDVVVEVLISSKNVQVAEISGDKTYPVPDIQATAIRLKDAKIMGQASSSDIVGSARPSDVREVAEATALALMEDMLTGISTVNSSTQ